MNQRFQPDRKLSLDVEDTKEEEASLIEEDTVDSTPTKKEIIVILVSLEVVIQGVVMELKDMEDTKVDLEEEEVIEEGTEEVIMANMRDTDINQALEVGMKNVISRVEEGIMVVSEEGTVEEVELQ